MPNSTRILLGTKPGEPRKIGRYKNDVAIWRDDAPRNNVKKQNAANEHIGRKLAIGDQKPTNYLLKQSQ